MKVIVIGCGYVGYPMALLMAKAGHEVVGVDTDPGVVSMINSGDTSLPEPGLRELANDPGVRRRIRGSSKVEPADVFMICVPTPLEKPRKNAEMSMVEKATRALAPHLEKGNLVVLESTVPPRTCRDMLTPIIEANGALEVGRDVLVAHCPERVLPGRALHEILHNPRIIGGIDEASTAAAAALYASFVKGELVRTDDVTAELCKLMENTYRDVNIALANELARVCRTLGVDVNQAIDIANRHPRVKFLRPGIGVGGHCIPIDPWFITEVDPEDCRLIPTARQINDAQPDHIARIIRREVREVADPSILCLGATYKQDTYDLREAPAIEIVSLLREDGYRVDLLDPITREYGGRDIVDAARGTHLVVVLVPHEAMMADLRARGAAVKRVMARERIVDVSRGAVAAL
jgi:UDP-N-acetyl-D-mannosaminuronic acid dehydrogenase